MKRNNNSNNNNRYRNNNNHSNNNNSNPAYSLSYRFDSNSSAGKVSGTALELIKKYNDLAKDAWSDGDYITSEYFRQYAEHYRKIVTGINEKRGTFQHNRPRENSNEADTKEIKEVVDVNVVATEPVAAPITQLSDVEPIAPVKKSFKVIEISDAREEKSTTAPKKTYRKKVAVAE